MMRIVVLLSAYAAFAACGKGGEGAAGGDGRATVDTAAGFRLGMLLPEARAAASARGDELVCELATTDQNPGSFPDSVRREMGLTEICRPASDPYAYRLDFLQGSLQAVIVSMSDDWDLIPVDTLVGRLSRDYGRPWHRTTYSLGAGRAEELITWRRDPALMMLRCPDAAGAGQCPREHRFLLPEPGEKAR